MKKTIVISTLAGVLLVGTSYANTNHSDLSDAKIETTLTAVKEVSVFCKSIAKGDLEAVKKMITHGQDVNERSNGMTPLMYAARYNRVDIIKLLVSSGAKVEAKCYRRNFTALKYAKLSNATEAEKLLMNHDKKKKK